MEVNSLQEIIGESSFGAPPGSANASAMSGGWSFLEKVCADTKFSPVFPQKFVIFHQANISEYLCQVLEATLYTDPVVHKS